MTDEKITKIFNEMNKDEILKIVDNNVSTIKSLLSRDCKLSISEHYIEHEDITVYCIYFLDNKTDEQIGFTVNWLFGSPSTHEHSNDIEEEINKHFVRSMFSTTIRLDD